jgi:hypothetical protein
LRLTNQRSPRRTSSARRLIAAPLHSVGYRQEAQRYAIESLITLAFSLRANS